MSIALFERRQARLKLYQQLEEAERDAVKFPGGLTHQKMMRGLRDRIS